MSATTAQLLDALRRDDLLLEAPVPIKEVTGLTTDSRQVERGMLYLAVRESRPTAIALCPRRSAGGRPP